jgi:serine/threonine-protein kinase RsbW
MNTEFTISCSKENLIHIRKFINNSLKSIRLRTTDLNLIVLAVDEVCANLIIHSNNCDHRKKLSINCEYSTQNGFLEIIIRDEGKLFEYKKYDEPQLDKIIEDKRKGGIGLLLVRKIMDNIEYTSDKFYNVTKLTKKINPHSLAS